MSVPDRHIDVVDLASMRVDLRRDGASTFVMPSFSTARQRADGVLAWDPGLQGLLGGLVDQGRSGDHGGERHLDGDELIVATSGRLTLTLLDESGEIAQSIPLQEGQATLVPQGVWHRLQVDAPCRYLFFGGGRTEIRRA